MDYFLDFYENKLINPNSAASKTIEVTINGQNDKPFYRMMTDANGTDTSNAKLNVSLSDTVKTQGTLSPYDADYKDKITHEVKSIALDAAHTTGVAQDQFTQYESALKALLSIKVGPYYDVNHSLSWYFNEEGKNLPIPMTTGSTLALDYTLRVTDILGAWADQNVHIELHIV